VVKERRKGKRTYQKRDRLQHWGQRDGGRLCKHRLHVQFIWRQWHFYHIKVSRDLP